MLDGNALTYPQQRKAHFGVAAVGSAMQCSVAVGIGSAHKTGGPLRRKGARNPFQVVSLRGPQEVEGSRLERHGSMDWQ